jgi:hypothetical protein
VKVWWRLTRSRAAYNFWFEGWFSSPKMVAKRERMFQRLEREHAMLTKAFG